MVLKDILSLLSVSSKITFMRCVTFSNVLYVFGLFMNNNQGMFTFQHESADLHQLLKNIIKYVEKLPLFACLIFSRTLFQTGYKFQASSFDELSFSHELDCSVQSSVTKVDFQVLCLQVGGSRKISEVQVRVRYYWQRLFSFT